MSLYAQAGLTPDKVRDLSPVPPELELFARIEGLVGEERALLAVPLEQRKQQQHERLRAIGDELDRIWEKLSERAKRLGFDHERPETTS
jgi:hypothetical protein